MISVIFVVFLFELCLITVLLLHSGSQSTVISLDDIPFLNAKAMTDMELEKT